MLPTASATLVSNLTASLANANHRWVVQRVSERRARIPSPSTSSHQLAAGNDLTFPNYTGTMVNAGEGLALGPSAPVDVHTDAVSVTIFSMVDAIVTAVDLVATKVRLAAGQSTMLELAYESEWISGAFARGVLRFNDGSAFVHANATLDTAIRTMALSLMTARQTPIEQTLAAGHGSADPIEMPADLLAALKASLADSTHEWFVMSTLQTRALGVTQFTAALATRKVKAAVGSRVPAQFTYVAKLNAADVIIDATIYTVGSTWRSFDTDLLASVQAKAAAFQAATADDLIEGLEAGPTTGEE